MARAQAVMNMPRKANQNKRHMLKLYLKTTLLATTIVSWCVRITGFGR
jgi:hypothetical protein